MRETFGFALERYLYFGDYRAPPAWPPTRDRWAS
jgi:hypothetical protein